MVDMSVQIAAKKGRPRDWSLITGRGGGATKREGGGGT